MRFNTLAFRPGYAHAEVQYGDRFLDWKGIDEDNIYQSEVEIAQAAIRARAINAPLLHLEGMKDSNGVDNKYVVDDELTLCITDGVVITVLYTEAHWL